MQALGVRVGADMWSRTAQVAAMAAGGNTQHGHPCAHLRSTNTPLPPPQVGTHP